MLDHGEHRPYVSPVYRNEDGTWPEVPDDHFLGEWFISVDGSGNA